MKGTKNKIPIYDIGSLKRGHEVGDDIIAEEFEPYLKVHPALQLPHRHAFCHIVLFTKGSGSHTIDFERFKVVPGQIYFMIPGQVHSWDFKGAVDGYVVNFSEALFQSSSVNWHFFEQFLFFSGVAKDGVVQLDAKTFPIVKSILQRVVNDVRAHDEFTFDLVRSLLTELFITVSRTLSKKAKTSAPHSQLTLSNFRKLVDRHYAEMRLPKEYAAMLYVTPNHLNALCRDLLGKSAGEVIRERILLEAKRLLVNLQSNISEIAAQLDFADSSHFTKFFKKYSGQTPEEFRKHFTDLK
jgi:AraC-like DNA-binding protein